MPDDHPTHVGHVHLKVRDVDRALEFYTEVLGLDVTERHGRYAFCSWGQHHHDVALQGLGADAPAPGPGVGMYHAAFEVDTPEALRTIFERLQDRGIQVSPVDHGISKALYFDDPAGNGLEVYLDTRMERDQQAWQGRNEPFDPTEL
ncbi:VOC family protein [Halapricum salinum]|uniref:Biphenyl-2,3-diol 1,2-dioxygenase n=1 Tax=Halapricum salinum TaxID=1457250 RepID=A0A4D6HB56_9EURY|nr:VOC family protein [Halapricum salinum]QCC51169.1 biphenyl-2,3-diol 1,2-dioxygenase [Halapricum salinum]